MIRFLNSITDVDAAQWDELWQTDYPFVQHRFLSILEKAGCTNVDSGWEPFHLIYAEGDKLLGAMLLYRKHHSYGEYVFDWGWADAYHRNGMEYYPKLLSAIPFTPATGPRYAVARGADARHVVSSMLNAIQKCLDDGEYSSFHLLFPAGAAKAQVDDSIFCERQGCQFHWFNAGYTSFDQFLEGFSSRKRKSVKRERRKVAEEGIRLEIMPAAALSQEDWRLFYGLYHHTYLKRSGRPGYLTEAFFQMLGQAFPDQVLLCRAIKDERVVAAALYLRDSKTLYGRYWGALEDYNGLHFEACYYQGIEYAIAEGLLRFDPGAQGEHKIQRGFIPVKTCSFHRMAHPGFQSAVESFVLEEKRQNHGYIEDGRNYLPFKEGVELVDIDTLIRP